MKNIKPRRKTNKELPEHLKKYALYKPAYHISGCSVLTSFLFLLLGAGFLYYEIKSRLAIGNSIVSILLSPLSTFAFSLIFLSYGMISNFIKHDLSPKNPHLYAPDKQYRAFGFKILNWLNTIFSLLYIFTNQWAMDGYIWAFLAPVSFFILMYGIYILSEKDSVYRKQKRYGHSMLHINAVKALNKQKIQMELQFFGDHVYEYCKHIELHLYKVDEFYSNKMPHIQVICSYHFDQISLKERQTIQIFQMFREDFETLDYHKKDGLTHWIAEVKGDDRRYTAIFYPKVEYHNLTP